MAVFILWGAFSLASCYENSLEELSGSGNCDTADISYSRDINPIIAISCAISGCHHAGTVETFPLASYHDVKAEAETGLLLKSINHEPGVAAMPKSASKLTDCDIGRITAWINAGGPDN